MKLTCDEVDEMLAAFAVDALPAHEREGVADHLEECRRHDREMAEHLAVVRGLASAADDASPPSRLRASLLASFDEEMRSATVIARARRTQWWQRPQFAYGLAAALLVAVIGLGAWNLSLRSNGSDLQVHRVATASGSLSVTYMADRKLAIIELSMPQLPADRAYQAWLVPRGGGAPTSLGMVAKDGPTAFSADLSGAAAVALSVEPPGGSPQPTTTPVLVDPLG